MNKVFKVKWNAALKRFDVTSELTTGKTKSDSGSKKSASGILHSVGLMAAGGLMMGISGSALADDVELIGFNPKTDNGVAMVISDDKTLVSGGSDGFSLITPGDRGFRGMTLRDAINQGYVTGPGLA